MCMEIRNNGRYVTKIFLLVVFSILGSLATIVVIILFFFGMLTFPFMEKWSETEEKAIEKCVQEGQSYEHCESVHSW